MRKFLLFIPLLILASCKRELSEEYLKTGIKTSFDNSCPIQGTIAEEVLLFRRGDYYYIGYINTNSKFRQLRQLELQVDIDPSNPLHYTWKTDKSFVYGEGTQDSFVYYTDNIPTYTWGLVLVGFILVLFTSDRRKATTEKIK